MKLVCLHVSTSKVYAQCDNARNIHAMLSKRKRITRTKYKCCASKDESDEFRNYLEFDAVCGLLMLIEQNIKTNHSFCQFYCYVGS